MEKQLKIHIYVWEYVCADPGLGGGSDLKDGLGVYLILLLMEAAFYLSFKEKIRFLKEKRAKFANLTELIV